MEDVIAAIGPKIRQLRRQKNLSLQQLAERSGVSAAAKAGVLHEKGLTGRDLGVIAEFADAAVEEGTFAPGEAEPYLRRAAEAATVARPIFSRHFFFRPRDWTSLAFCSKEVQSSRVIASEP